VENFQICPYTGLRSFTEDESLYFKGREDDIDQATSQLQRNKFLMITGASGDGKSSLVYAGVIPNARAGFLKSRYSNWCIADFRPERAPLQNLCKSLSKQLDITNTQTVERELNHGFSALVDLYKNSKRYVDTSSIIWQQADDKGRAVIKREAANLIILVDQFEEFFTNPENYQQGAPTRDSNLVLNLLLETARIALEEELPIYVIFTMRSDYIGQCAAFRGLPEYIGFSQFFVPHLNRSQLQQVIEEPARLSGNRITRRLTERLIHDLTEGVDQLPILQHALNQIWVAADHGNEEMDLVHYAMSGGMSVNELPDDQVPRFTAWFNALPASIKACYHAPSLQNVLDTHTNKLYEQASSYYTTKTGMPISDDEAKTVIRVSFTCLTKIDQSRAVRNRMTLQEITNIVNRPSFDARAVGTLLNIFREPGNTFIHPFIMEEDPDSQDLRPNQVLDITHESLIRNWQYLGRWAKEEFDSRSISLDFEKQLDRWVQSGKANTFLLPIGPLTYFEGWYKRTKPNAWWIARYLQDESTKENKLSRANNLLDNAQEFLKKSGRKHGITRTIMRFGPKRIGAAIGILALFVLTSFGVSGYVKRLNGQVLKSIHQRSLALLANPNADNTSKAAMVCEQLKLGQTTINEVVGAMHDPIDKISFLNTLASLMVFQGLAEPKNEIQRALVIADSLLESLPLTDHDPVRMSTVLVNLNNFRVTLELAYYHSGDPQIDAWRKRNAERSGRWAYTIAEAQPEGFVDIQNFNLALENAINYQTLSNNQLTHLLGILSPFENGLQTPWLKANFHKDKLLIRGSEPLNYGFSFNGLYQELAYLYAAMSNSAKALQCVDSLLAYSQNNFQGDYAAGMDNATNIAAIFFQQQNTEQLDQFVAGYCLKKKTTLVDFYQRLIARTIPGLHTMANLRLFWWSDETQNLNLQFAGRKQLGLFFARYRQVVQSSVKDPNEQNFLMAVSFKDEGILGSLIQDADTSAKATMEDDFSKAFHYFWTVDKTYLDEPISVIDMSASDQSTAPRKMLFEYPDFRTSFHPGEPRSYVFFAYTDRFMAYILDHHLFDSTYLAPEDLEFISQWLNTYNSINFVPRAFLSPTLRYRVLQGLDQELRIRKAQNSSDFNALYLYLGFQAQKNGQIGDLLAYYHQLNYNNLFNLLRITDFVGNMRNHSFRLIGFCVKGYVQAGRPDEAHRLVSIFKNPINRSSLYAFAAEALLREKASDSLIQPLIDSARQELTRVQDATGDQPNRRVLAYALMMQDPKKNMDTAFALIKNLPIKSPSFEEMCRSFAFSGDLYDARSVIPHFISGSDEAAYFQSILYGYAEGSGKPAGDWQAFIHNYSPLANWFIEYIDENN
jgi:energy-coupling factor transporter ATP-binding protein EcfA2